jgi:hypothetical protein
MEMARALTFAPTTTSTRFPLNRARVNSGVVLGIVKDTQCKSEKYQKLSAIIGGKV